MKKAGIVLLLTLFIFPINKIHAEDDAGFVSTNTIIENTEKFVEENIPDSIKKPTASVANIIEKFRKNIGALLENEKVKIKTEIEILKNGETPSNSGTEEKKLNKILTYAKFYLFTFSSSIINNAITFYIISAIFLFLLFRRIWRLVF